MWEKTFGGTGRDWASFIKQISDGGYIVCGSTNSFGFGSWDVYVLKLDSNGNKTWEGTFGGSGQDFGSAIQQTIDGGYIFTGVTYSFGINGDVYVVKTDSNGNKIWEKNLGGSGNDQGSSIQQTTDGGYTIGGLTDPSWPAGPAAEDFYIVKLDVSGNAVWGKTYGGAGRDIGSAIEQTTDGGYIATGSTNSMGAGNFDFYIIKLDNTGNKIWEKTYGGSGSDRAFFVQQTTDGGYVVAGATLSFGAGAFDAYVLKLNSLGQIVPVITSISPNSSPNSAPVSVLIEGSNFKQGAAVKLQLAGQADILGTSVQVLSSSEIRCIFDITGTTKGFWDVVVTNPDAVEGRLTGGFEVIGPQPVISSVTPDWGVNTGSVTVVIAGRNFHPSQSTAALKRSGQPDIDEKRSRKNR